MIWLLLTAVWVAVLSWRIDFYGRRQPPPKPAGAIVVLGAKVHPSGRASAALEHRVAAGVALFQKGLSPRLVFSGGSFGSEPSEAAVCLELALAAGVPRDACVLEEKSRNTLENAAFTAPLLTAHGIRDVIVVSDGFHLFRAHRLFARQGLRCQLAPSGRVLSTGDRLRALAQEIAALARTPALWFPPRAN